MYKVCFAHVSVCMYTHECTYRGQSRMPGAFSRNSCLITSRQGLLLYKSSPFWIHLSPAPQCNKWAQPCLLSVFM